MQRLVGNAKVHTIRCRTMSSLPQWFSDATTTNPDGLPRLPIPSLYDTMTRYLQTIKPLGLSAQDYEAHAKLANDFEKTVGPSLHEALVKQDADAAANPNAYPYSYMEEIWDSMYLGSRCPSVIHINPCYGLVDESTSVSMPERVSNFVTSMFKFRLKMQMNALEPDGGCMSTFAKQFGTSRHPRKTMDTWDYAPESSHIAILCREKVFKLKVMSPDGKPLRRDLLQEKLEQIMHEAAHGEAGIPVSALTGDERDTWARVREAMESSDAQNSETLQMIDSAFCVVALDERSSGDMATRASLSLHGAASNRWYDKLQIIAYADGHLGINFEHSTSDGTAWNRWIHEVLADMKSADSGFSPLPTPPEWAGDSNQVAESPWKLSSDLRSEVEKSHERLSLEAANLDMVAQDFTSLSKNDIKKWKCSPDGVVQMGLQLAFSQLHGMTPPTYESCATRGFHHGRTETIRSASIAAKAWVDAVNDKASTETQLAVFKEAVNGHVDLAKRAQKGMGVDRHLMALASIASEKGISDPFLTSDVRAMSSSFRISSSNVTAPFLQYFGFGPVVPDGYGIGYLIQNDHISGTVSSFKSHGATDSEKFAAAVNDAFLHIKSLHQGTRSKL